MAPTPAELGLSSDESKAYNYLYGLADKEDLGVLTGDKAVAFFEAAGLPGQTLGEIWALADDDNTGFLTKEGFAAACRLIGHSQNGQKPSQQLIRRTGPLAYFRGISNIPGISKQPTPPSKAGSVSAPSPARSREGNSSSPAPTSASITISPDERARYTRIFANAGPIGGLLDGEKASDILSKSKLSNDKLSQIWNLADRQRRGGLDSADFIIAMALVQALMNGTLSSVPSTLPPSLVSQVGPPSSVPSSPIRAQSAVPLAPQRTGQAMPSYAQSSVNTNPLRASTVSNVSSAGGGAAWAISPVEKAQSDTFFAMLDTARSGYITGDVAVPFFLQSGLGEDVLAQVWDLSDIQKEGRLGQDEFAVARRLIMDTLSGKPVPGQLDDSMIPPKLRAKQQPQQSEVQRDLFSLMDDDIPATPASPVQAPAPSTFTNQRVASPAPLQPMHTGGSARAAQPIMPNYTGGSFRSATPLGATTRGAPPPVPAMRSALASPVAQSPQQATRSRQQDFFASASDDEEDEPAASTASVAKQKELSSLKDDVASTQRSASGLRDQRTKLAKETVDIDKQLDELRVSLSQAKAAYDVESTNMSNLEARHKTGSEELKKLKQQVITAESDLSALREQKSELEQSILKDKEEMRELNRKIKVTNEEVTALKESLEKINKEARQQRGVLVVNRKQLSTAESARENTQASIASAQRDLKDVKREVAESEKQIAASIAPAAAVLHEQAINAPLPQSGAASPAISVASGRSMNPFERRGTFSPAAAAAAGGAVGLAAGAVAAQHHVKSPLGVPVTSDADLNDQTVLQGEDDDPFGVPSVAGHGSAEPSGSHAPTTNDFGFDDDFAAAFGAPPTPAAHGINDDMHSSSYGTSSHNAAAHDSQAAYSSSANFDDAFGEAGATMPTAEVPMTVVDEPGHTVGNGGSDGEPVDRDYAAPHLASTATAPHGQLHPGSTSMEQYASRPVTAHEEDQDDDDNDDLPPIQDIQGPDEDSDSDSEGGHEHTPSQHQTADLNHSAAEVQTQPNVHHDPLQHATVSNAGTGHPEADLPGAYPSGGDLSDNEDAFVDARSAPAGNHSVSPTGIHESDSDHFRQGYHDPGSQASHHSSSLPLTEGAGRERPNVTSGIAREGSDDFDDFEDLAPAHIEPAPVQSSGATTTSIPSAPSSGVPVTAASANFDDAFDDDFGFDNQTFLHHTITSQGVGKANDAQGAVPGQVPQAGMNVNASASGMHGFDDAFDMPSTAHTDSSAPPLPKRPAVGFDDDFFSSAAPPSNASPAAPSHVANTNTRAPSEPTGLPPSYVAPPPMPARQPSTKPLSQEDALDELVAMGFSRQQAKSALEDNQYDVTRAANALLAVNM